MSHEGSPVLRIATITDTSGVYFLQDPAREVNDLSNEHCPGKWLGSGATRLNLAGPVSAQSLSAVLEGTPQGSTIRRSVRRKIAGFDLMFAAPKCVSVLFASSDHDVAGRVLAAHHLAVGAAIDYGEQRAVGIARQGIESDRKLLSTDGCIAARFTHGVSRSGDPHLHSHLVIANLAHGDDGRFGTLDSLSLRAHGPAMDALYRSHLRAELTESLAIRWERDGQGREQIAGIPDSVVLALSGRSAEHKGGGRAWPEKIFQSRKAAEALWAERLRLAPMVENITRFPVAAGYLDEHRFAALLYGKTIRQRDVVEAWSTAAGSGIKAAVIAAAMHRHGSDLGRGRFEEPIVRKQVQPEQVVLRAIGPRPLGHSKLTEWWEREASIERMITVRAGLESPGISMHRTAQVFDR